MRFLISVILLPVAYKYGGWVCVAACLIGAIPTGYLFVKQMTGIDLRKIGSGTTGATQVRRALYDHYLPLFGEEKAIWIAKWCERTVLFIDSFKAALPVAVICWGHHSPVLSIWFGVFAILGNIFPIFLKGKGGKGAGTAFGVLFGLQPYIAAIVFAVSMAVRWKTRFVSKATTVAAIATILLEAAFITWTNLPAGFHYTFMGMAGVILLAHIPNWIRLHKGTERRIDDPEPKKAKEVLFLAHSQSPDPNYYKDKICKKLGRFAFLVSWMPATWIIFILRLIGTFKYAEVIGVTSKKTGQVVNMRVYVQPYYVDELLANLARSFKLMCKAIYKALAKYGVVIVGLGAHTAIICDNGKQLAEKFKDIIAIISGNVLTTISAVKSLVKLVLLAGYDLSQETVTIIGGTGSIGKAVAKWLVKKTNIGHIIIHSTSEANMKQTVREIDSDRVTWDPSLHNALQQSRLVICSVSATDIKIEASWFLPGTIVVEISRPRVISENIAKDRKENDVIVIAGGMYELPGKIVSNFNIGFRPNEFLACVSETMLRVLAGLIKTSVGKDIEFEELEEMEIATDEHGFVLGRFRPCDDGAFDPSRVIGFFDFVGVPAQLEHFVIQEAVNGRTA